MDLIIIGDFFFVFFFRLALYSGVLLHELHLSNMILIKRKWNIEKHEDNVKLLKEADDSLKEAKEVLKKETSNVSGEKLYNLLASSEKDMRRWLDRYKIDLDKEIAKLKLEEHKNDTTADGKDVNKEEVNKKEIKEVNKKEVKVDGKKEVKDNEKKEVKNAVKEEAKNLNKEDVKDVRKEEATDEKKEKVMDVNEEGVNDCK